MSSSQANSLNGMGLVYFTLATFSAFLAYLVGVDGGAPWGFQSIMMLSIAVIVFLVTAAAAWKNWIVSDDVKVQVASGRIIYPLFGAYMATVGLVIAFAVVGLFLLGYDLVSTVFDYILLIIPMTTLALYPFMRKHLQ